MENKVNTFQLYVITDLESVYSEFNKGHGMMWKIYVSVWNEWDKVRKDNNCNNVDSRKAHGIQKRERRHTYARVLWIQMWGTWEQ